MKLKTFTKVGAALSAAFVLTSVANATMVNGQIDFGLTATLDSPLLINATEVSSWNFVIAVSPTDDFDTFVNTGDVPSTFTAPWSFVSGAVSPLWVVGGFTFDLTSSSIFQQNANFLDVRGTGMVTGNGFDPTPGNWTFTITSASGSGSGVSGTGFSFVASNNTNVPDGGTTVALLGFSLLGLHGVRRKFAKR
ncbi:MAG: VPDSG-CTERM sorting domain-containing protein [Verrucomicrobiota bacterium]